jgi:hypothetical protein
MLALTQGKDLELQVLRDRVKELDDWLSQMSNRLQEEAYQKVSFCIFCLYTAAPIVDKNSANGNYKKS